MLSDQFQVVHLLPEQWSVLKDVRLAALSADPQAFGSTHAKELALSDAQWQERLENLENAVFVVMHEGQPQGMLGLACKEPESRAVVLWGLWVAPQWRGQGLSLMLQQAGLDWARCHGVQSIHMSHRYNNAASRKFATCNGYRLTLEQQGYVWPDGQEEVRCHYELNIRGEGPDHVAGS